MYKTPIRSKRPLHNTFDLGSRLEHIKNSLADMKENVTDKTSDLLVDSLKAAKRQTKKVDRFVAKRRYKTLGVTALTFLCIGYFMRK
jgi:ElaB/YqjD/DUF883 family membrane-anchored ribosome-binding protein